MRAGGQGGWIQLLALIGGTLAPWLLTSPAPGWLSAALLVAGSVLLLPARLRWAAFFLLGCGISLWQLQWRLADRLDPALAVTVHAVEGVIASLPDEQDEYARFLFAPGATARAAGLPSRLLVYWYRDWPELRAGQSWRLELLLKPPWGAVNFQGPDRERWLFSQGIGGLATVRSGEPTGDDRPLRFALHRLREDIRQRIVTRLGEGRESGVIRALAIADRAGMSRADRQLMMATGTSHLLAISGLHIGLAAIGGFWLVRALLWLLPFGFAGARDFWLCLGGALLLAGVYACLAGLGVATRRAMLMLLIGMAALALARSIHPARALALSAAAILLLDPFAALTAGFWFSFLAVAALLWMFVPRFGRMPWWKSLLMAQLAVVVVMMPVSLFWFEAFALTGFLVNLVAIPWVSLVLVPLTLFSMLAIPASAALTGFSLHAAAAAAALLLDFLEWMDGLHGLIGGVPAPTAWQLLGGVFAGLLLMLPRALNLRWLSLFLLLPMFLPPAASTAPGSLLLEVLDVGQGTAITVSTPRHTLLYDSGPGDGRAWHRVDSVLRPALIRRAG
ncbi:MAG: DNA internalization-related competence protein ComEC/Rec2, partial [Xanthomonadales bacterium]|nr:DNA internalization-related competence protein ComEC/Rec2 [Xanthomonadales bacterium]